MGRLGARAGEGLAAGGKGEGGQGLERWKVGASFFFFPLEVDSPLSKPKSCSSHGLANRQQGKITGFCSPLFDFISPLLLLETWFFIFCFPLTFPPWRKKNKKKKKNDPTPQASLRRGL